MSPAASLGESHRYRLGSRVATGGMGEVWKATDTLLDREVAVKVLKTEYADDPLFRTRFQAEARNAAALHHPGVASVFDFGDVPADDGSGSPRPYLVMELVPGQPLSALLRGDQPMPADTAADLVAQAADAIGAAHSMGIVHRDVKPANILVTPEGQVKITDFGIARAADAVGLTQTGEVLGTPHYISPEQAAGEPATQASDIYSLGVVLFECLAGRRPFQADTPVLTALAHLREPVPPLPDTVPAQLRDTVATALSKDPAQRFGSAADMAAALRGGSVGAAAGAAGVGAAGAAATQVMTPGTQVLAATPQAGTWRRSLPAWWLLAAAALAVLLVVLLSWALFGNESDPGNTPADNQSAPESVPQEDPTPEDDRIRVRAADYLGQDAKDASDQLRSLGFEVREEKTPATSEDQRKDTVASVTPNGLVDPGATITLGVWEEFRPPDDKDEDDKGSKPGKDEKPDKGTGPDQSKDDED